MILSCQNINKSFVTDDILQDVSFHLEEREKAALIGPNGAGKTTLFNCISHEIDFEGGSVSLEENGENRPVDFDMMGYAFSTPVLPEFLTGYEFIKFFLDIHKGKIENPLTVEEYAQMVGLDLPDLDRLLKG